jgi:hypothetical protein
VAMVASAQAHGCRGSSSIAALGDLKYMIAELSLDRAQWLANLAAKYDLIELGHHLAAAKRAEIAATCAGRALGVFLGKISKIATLANLIDETLTFGFGFDEDMASACSGHGVPPCGLDLTLKPALNPAFNFSMIRTAKTAILTAPGAGGRGGSGAQVTTAGSAQVAQDLTGRIVTRGTGDTTARVGARTTHVQSPERAAVGAVTQYRASAEQLIQTQ